MVSGGTHFTEVPLAQWPKSLVLPSPEFTSLEYDKDKQLFSIRGALAAEERDRWTSRTDDPAFHQAIRKLYRRSHYAPISDEYGYNQRYAGVTAYRVRDVMLEFDLDQVPNAGGLTARLAHGRTHVDCRFDFVSQTMDVLFHSSTKPVETISLPTNLPSGPHQFMVSVFDGQLVVGID